MQKLMFIFIFIFISFMNIVAVEIWDLKIEKEIPYTDISSDFFGTGYSFLNTLPNNDIIFYNNNSTYYIYDVDKKKLNVINTKGKGPGEFQSPSRFILFNNQFYCIDKDKRSLIIYTKNFQYVNEIRLDFSPLAIFNYSDSYFGIISSPLDSENLINLYDKTNKKQKSFLSSTEPIEKYKSKVNKNFFYSTAHYFMNKNILYIFFGNIPIIQKYDFSEEKSEFIDYKEQLSFKPTAPILEYNLKAALYFCYPIYPLSKNNIVFKAGNRNSIKETLDETQYYAFKFSFITEKIEMIKINNKEISNSIFHTVFYKDKSLLFFNDENEKLEYYEIKKK